MNFNLAIANSLNEANELLAKVRANLIPEYRQVWLKRARMLIQLAAYWRAKREQMRGA